MNTQTPYTYERQKVSIESWIVLDANGDVVCDELTETKAEFIVRSCNTNDDLIAVMWKVLPKLLQGSPEWQIVHDVITKSCAKA